MLRLRATGALILSRGARAALLALAVLLSMAGPSLCAADTLSETIVVLPFFNLSPTSGPEWIGESVAEVVRESLSAYGLLTLGREDRLAAYQRLSLRPGAVLTRATILKVGEVIDADLIVFGEYFINSAAGQTASLRVTARVLSLRKLGQGHDFSESGPLNDLARLEAHLSWQMLKSLAPQSAPSEEEFGKRQTQVRVDALENYVRGLMAKEPEQRQKFFLEALRLDSRFSQPAFQLGRLAVARKDYKSAADYLARIQPGQLQFCEASFLYGLSKYHLGDGAAAARAFGLVLETVPLNEVYNNLGVAQFRRDPAAAIESFRKAVEGDPNDPIYQFNLGFALWKRGEFAEAAQHLKTALDRDPDDQETQELLDRAEKKSGYRQARGKRDSPERLKTNYEERAYWQLRAVLQPNASQPKKAETGNVK